MVDLLLNTTDGERFVIVLALMVLVAIAAWIIEAWPRRRPREVAHSSTVTMGSFGAIRRGDEITLENGERVRVQKVNERLRTLTVGSMPVMLFAVIVLSGCFGKLSKNTVRMSVGVDNQIAEGKNKHIEALTAITILERRQIDDLIRYEWIPIQLKSMMKSKKMDVVKTVCAEMTVRARRSMMAELVYDVMAMVEEKRVNEYAKIGNSEMVRKRKAYRFWSVTERLSSAVTADVKSAAAANEYQGELLKKAKIKKKHIKKFDKVKKVFKKMTFRGD